MFGPFRCLGMLALSSRKASRHREYRFTTKLVFAISLLSLSLFSLNSGIAQDKMPTKLTTVEGIAEYRLDNGFRVLLFSDNSQPKVTINCTIFVGSRHEGYGEAGMAHLLEHMLFKGTELNPEIPKSLKDRGANFNGTTSFDRTNYYETLPATDDNLEFAIRLEADRLVNSRIRGEDLMSEFSVVRSEFERGENRPVAVLQQRMFSSAYLWHNYGNSTIGNRSDIERVPVESLRAFYRRHYRPENAMLVVAGKFEAKKTLELVQKYFGSISNPKTPLNPTYTVEPPQDGERITMVRRVGDVQYVGVMYHIPAASDDQFPAADLMSVILSDEPSGRLYKSLIEEKLATDLFSNAFGLHDPGALLFLAQVPKEKSIDEAQVAMIDTLEQLASNPITDEEVDRARRQILNRRERLASKTESLAIELSDWAAQGDWRLYFLFRDGIERTTALDVQNFAQRYLVRNNRTVGLFVPSERSERIDIPERPLVAKKVDSYQGREGLSEGEVFDPTPKNIEGRVVRGELKTGIPYAFLSKKTRGGVVNVTLNLRFGDEKSLFGKSSAQEMLGDMLMRGTKSMTLQQLNDRLSKLQAILRVSSAQQFLNVTIETKRNTLLEVLDVLHDVLRNPAFEEKEFSLLQEQALTQLEDSRREPQTAAYLAVQRVLNPYKRGDMRYVPTVEEEIEDVRGLKLSDIRDLHARFLSGSEGEVAAVGDFDVVELESKLSAILSNWKCKVQYQRVASSATTDVKTPIQTIETPDKANAIFYACQQYTLRDDHPNYPALLMGNYILGGGGLSSRLVDRVRQKEGLSYSVSSSFAAHPIDERATLTISASSNPANRDKLVKMIDEELRKLVKDGITEKELKDSVQGFLQNQQLVRSRDSSLAMILTSSLFSGRNMNYFEKLEADVAALTVDDVNEAISEYFSPDTLVVATAGDFAQPTKKP